MKIIRTTELLDRLGISESTLHRWRKAGEFPEPRKLGGRAVGWTEREVEAWIDSRPRASTGGDPEAGDE